ncbi:MAG: urea ABC transporter permease subunit UrtB [Rhodocyclaceae bacterium]|jgi:urea transport system permease protein|nr:urea ABC transporter permease subunit UrtB [Rhodocyclaceae bacterium]
MKSALFALLLWLIAAPSLAVLDPATVKQLAAEESDDRIAAIRKLAQTADPEALRVLKALSEDALHVAGDRIVAVEGDRVLDAISGRELKPAPENRDGITINNRIRGELSAALAVLRLFDPDRQTRLQAAQELAGSADAEMAPLLARALEKERDPRIGRILSLAHAQANLKNPDAAVRLAAVKALGESGNPNVKNLLAALTDKNAEPDEKVRIEAAASVRAVESRLAFGDNAGRVFSGLSLGSILLLAALGLAITYGVMGVINMAHGELLMVGAYATFAMQTVFRNHFPGALDWYVAAAIPAAFFAAALVGIVMERTVIRFLYGRPLETLLATWGISLFLIQAARSLFGAQNVEVANPAWMSGGIEIANNIVLPLNRIAIVGFSLFVLALVWVLMNRTRLGMFVRAVTQNRPMAGCVGVPTGRMDTLAFGLGAGIAGLGGVALSQIANVGPDMGQGYIVDSFMVVVLGGVGQLAGAVWAALGLGVVTKFLEGWTGAVIAKIVVLVFIIIFIQKRPQGLFALKGRFAEN